jgi:hypothetical protein
MIAPFDIFKDTQGSLMWCGTAMTLDEAKAKVHAMAARERTEYVIFSQKTGNRLVIQPDEQKPTAD